MSWLLSFVVALIAAIAGAVAAGLVANLCVVWYHVSSREGASGYFVISIALLGGLASGAIGLVVSRVVAASARPGFAAAAGGSLAAVLGIAAAAGGVARLLADVPPMLDGSPLWLIAEIRCPEGMPSPVASPGKVGLRLGSLSGRTMRASESGALFPREARLENGRWIVPGAVQIFTTRGKRLLGVELGGKEEFFTVPLRKYPGTDDLRWSDWLPRSPAKGQRLSYRYRVQRQDDPLKTETFGPFEIETITSGLYETDRGVELEAFSEFRIRRGGEVVVLESPAEDGDPAARHERAGAVLTVAAPRPALVCAAGREAACLLIEEVDGRVRTTYLGRTASHIDVNELTGGPPGADRRPGRPRGWVDRVALAHEGIFLIGGTAVLDTRTLSVHRITRPDNYTQIPAVPPLALSPDGRSFAWFAYEGGQEETPVLAVTDFVANETYAVPVDPARMRFARLEKLDAPWVVHHFAWQRGENGTDRLVERPGFTPLPYRGDVITEASGYREYRLEPAGEPLREALIEFLVERLHAERSTAEPDAYAKPLRLDGQTIEVNHGSFGAVTVTMARDSKADLLDEIAERFDAELATGKHDALFVK